jgi:hypothetical protein
MSGEVGQDELKAKRARADAIRQIEHLHAVQIVNLQIWQRLKEADREHSQEGRRTLTAIMEARREENTLLRNALGIDITRPAIEKKH